MDVIFVAETVMPSLISSATSVAAPAVQTMVNPITVAYFDYYY